MSRKTEEEEGKGKNNTEIESQDTAHRADLSGKKSIAMAEERCPRDKCTKCQQALAPVTMSTVGVSAWQCMSQSHSGHNHFQGSEDMYVCSNMMNCQYGVCEQCFLGSNKSLPRLKLGDRIGADYLGEGQIKRGRLKSIRSDGSYDVEYEDGSREYRVTADRLIPMSKVFWKSLKEKVVLCHTQFHHLHLFFYIIQNSTMFSFHHFANYCINSCSQRSGSVNFSQS